MDVHFCIPHYNYIIQSLFINCFIIVMINKLTQLKCNNSINKGNLSIWYSKTLILLIYAMPRLGLIANLAKSKTGVRIIFDDPSHKRSTPKMFTWFCLCF